MLSLKDLRVVLTELHKVRDKWYNLGLQLQVSVIELQKIEAEYKTDTGTCLRKMLIKRLELGNASWESLCEALQSTLVLGGDAALAITLQKKYCRVGESESKQKKRPASVSVKPGKEPSVKVLCSILGELHTLLSV